MVSKRMLGLGTARSVIRELFEYGNQRAAVVGRENVYDFSLGNPSVPAPDAVNEAAIRILREQPELIHCYTSAQGDAAARQRFADSLNRRFGGDYTADQFYITVGAAASLCCVFHGLTCPGDEFIVFAPYFPEYKVFIEGAGAKMVLIPPETEHFQIDFAAFEQALPPHTKGVVVNSPNNPSGVVYSRETLERLGKMPLPPYIKAELSDPERYQTVYSREVGSAAAPTAGLHFTRALLEQVQEMGVKVCYVTLHVGLGTFRPVKEEEITDHEMHSEYCMISAETAETINRTKREGGRVICVGTTSCRTIESWAAEDGTLKECAGWTNIFIYPGYRFKALDCLITNFHLPESTLIMLVSALAGREHVLAAYKEAVEQRYRFFSFGDAMFIG